MTNRLRRPLARAPLLGTGYAIALVVAHVWLRAQSPARRAAVLAASSTDLSHLQRTPWIVLPVSAIWPGGRWLYWVAAAGVCVGALELFRGPLVAAIVGVAAHVVGTLVSEGQVAVRIALGDLPESARRLLDVGPSYVVLGCGVAVVAAASAPRVSRTLCAALLLPLVVIAFDLDSPTLVSTVGHLVAVAVGLAAAWQMQRQSSPARDGSAA